MSSSRKQLNFHIESQQIQEPVNPVDNIVTNIKRHSLENGNLLNKYNEQFYLTYFDRNKIQHTVTKMGYEDSLKKQLTLQQFMRLFLSFIQHNEQQTLFLAMSLRNMFIKIKETTSNQIGVKFTDFTNYLCDQIAANNNDIIVPLKQVPVQKIVPDVKRVRQIDLNPPIVLMNKESDQPRIAKEKKKIDKKLKQKKPVSKFIYNSSNQQIIAMGRLSSTIHFYDMELRKLPIDIVPKTFKDVARQIAILSIDFDEYHQRIGAIINGMGISFWQMNDNLSTQKTIAKSSGDRIQYLKLFKQWVTTDKNTINFWDIKEETVSAKIVCQNSVMINSVCEINHLRCLAVTYTTTDEKKPIVFYKDLKPIAKYQMVSQGCHTLHYNVASQLIIAAGYNNQLQVLELQNKTFSINLIKQLKGHRSIITCVSDIQSTNFILSGDDLGEVRIWQLNSMKCIQVVQVAKSITQLYCTGEKLIFSDSRLNIMEMDKFSPISNNDQQIIQDFFNQENDKHIIITRKSIKIIDFNNGRVQKIFVVCDQQEEISSAVGLNFGVIIGTSKGIMKFFSMEGQLRWQLPAHEAEITQLRYDRKTRFIFTLGNDNKLMIWPQKTLLQEGPKKVISFKSKIFNILTLFNEARLLFLASTQENEICVWDFKNLKLITIIKLNAPCLFMEFNQLYKIMMISTVNDQIYLFKLIWKNGHLNYQLIYNGDSQLLGHKNTKKVYYGQHSQQNSLNKIQQQLGKNAKNTKVKISVKTIDFEDHEENQKNIPSIKVIKPQKYQVIVQDAQPTLGTLKTLKKIENQITTRIEIKQTQNSSYLVIGNSKGQIFCYDISILIKEHFPAHQLPLKKSDSPHLYRPGKQEYEMEEAKKKYHLITNQNVPRIPKTKKSYFKQVWKQSCVNREPISCLSFIEMKNTYLAITMTDGHCKYFDLENGNLKGNMKVSLPLPILWEIQVEKDCYIKKNLYETLIILDNILTNHGFQMLSKQYKSINVTSFLEILKRKKGLKSATSIKKMNFKEPEFQRQKKAVTLLHEEYSVQDLKKSPQNGKISNLDGQSSLKSLQVYKRVKQIKLQMMQDVKQKQEKNKKKDDDGIERLSAEVLKEKQDIIKLLKPNYFSIVSEYGTSSNMSKSFQLGSLQQRSQILLKKVNENKKKLNSQYVDPKESNKIQKKQSVNLPNINFLRHQSLDSKQSQCSKQGKVSDSIKEENLVSKLMNSLSTTSLVKQKNYQQPNYFTSSFLSTFIKPSASPSNNNHKSLTSSPKSSQLPKASYLRLNSGKQNDIKEKEIMDKIQQATTREILSQLNEKLQKYKKSSYNKRQGF